MFSSFAMTVLVIKVANIHMISVQCIPGLTAIHITCASQIKLLANKEMCALMRMSITTCGLQGLFRKSREIVLYHFIL